MKLENFINGDFKQIANTIALTFVGFSFANPKVFELISNSSNGNTKYESILFLFFCFIYLLLPLLSFLIFSFFRRRQYPGLYKIGKKDYNTFHFLLFLFLFLLLINSVSFYFNSSNSSKNSPSEKKPEEKSVYEAFDELNDFKILSHKKFNATFTSIDSILETSEITYFVNANYLSNKKNISLTDAAIHNSGFVSPKNWISYLDTLKYNIEEVLNQHKNNITITDINFIKQYRDINYQYFKKYYLEKEANGVKSTFISLLEKIRDFYFIELFLILIVLGIIIYVYKKQKREKSVEWFLIKTLVGIYILIGVQLLTTSDFKNINIENEGFQYKVSGWYSPAFFKNVSNSASNIINDNSRKNYTNQNDFEKIGIKLDNISIILRDNNESLKKISDLNTIKVSFEEESISDAFAKSFKNEFGNSIDSYIEIQKHHMESLKNIDSNTNETNKKIKEFDTVLNGVKAKSVSIDSNLNNYIEYTKTGGSKGGNK